MATWNWLDWILAAIIVASAVTAMRKGFVQELISLASVVVGLVVAAIGYPRAALWFEDLTKSHEIALGLGFLVLFLGTLLVGAIVGMLARKLIETAGIQWFDRFLGGIFGLVRGVLVDAILLMAMVAFAIKPDSVRQSALVPYVTTGTRVIAFVMPGNLKAQFRLGFQKFRESLIQHEKRATKD
ncbi:MAG: CvpA family protein [Terriglobia bacterium]|jgi:membrane protein required for colicin V production